jgi:hypothetical protein
VEPPPADCPRVQRVALEGIVVVGVALEGIVVVGVALEGIVVVGVALEGVVVVGVALEVVVVVGVALEGVVVVGVALRGFLVVLGSLCVWMLCCAYLRVGNPWLVFCAHGGTGGNYFWGICCWPMRQKGAPQRH